MSLVSHIRLTTLYKTCYSQGMAKVSGQISKFSKNLITSAADLVLFKIYLGADWKFMGDPPSAKGGSKADSSAGEGMWQGFSEAFPEMPELDARKILRALKSLLKQGFIELAPSEAHLVPQITEEGGKRLDSIFPVYQKERLWDQKFYLVNYDIPVGKNSARDALRLFLKGRGCVMLQSSVWLTPYNPTKELNRFVEKRRLKESVVVSVLLDEWAFGGRDVPAVLNEIYGLEEVNRRYREFVGGVDGLKDVKDPPEADKFEKMTLAFDYFEILNADPQLPFELLPHDWAGAKAQELFENLFFGR